MTPREIGGAIISASNAYDETFAIDGKELVLVPGEDGSIKIDLAWLAEDLDADIGMTERFHSQCAYSCDLQRTIEALCNGSELREPETGARHHYNMAVTFRANNSIPDNVATALRLCKRLMDNMNEFNGTCTDSETYDAAWIAVNFAMKELGQL